MKIMYGCRKDGYFPLDEENLNNVGLTETQVINSVPTEVIIVG